MKGKKTWSLISMFSLSQYLPSISPGHHTWCWNVNAISNCKWLTSHPISLFYLMGGPWLVQTSVCAPNRTNEINTKDISKTDREGVTSFLLELTEWQDVALGPIFATRRGEAGWKLYQQRGEWIKDEKKEKTLIISFEQLNPDIPEIIMIANQLASLLESLILFKLGCPDS